MLESHRMTPIDPLESNEFWDDADWLALKRKIEQTVQLEHSEIQLGNRMFNWLKVANPDDLLVAAVASGPDMPAEELDPFWAATWRAAQGLDRFLDSLELRNVRVLELGCGSGQAGVGAAARGADVLLTDVVDLALQVAQLNSWPVRERVAFRRLNWKNEQLAEPKFPTIIGSDLVYDPNLFPLLDRCARLHLANNGKMYLSEPHRHTGDRFSQWIKDAGWSTVEHDVDMGDNRIPIRIFECSLPSTGTR